MERASAASSHSAPPRAHRFGSLPALAVVVLALASVRPALAGPFSQSHSGGSNCSAAATGNPGGALACRLTGLLHILSVTAVVLGVVLLAVIIVAVRVYRQNRASSGRR